MGEARIVASLVARVSVGYGGAGEGEVEDLDDAWDEPVVLVSAQRAAAFMRIKCIARAITGTVLVGKSAGASRRTSMADCRKSTGRRLVYPSLGLCA